MKFISAVTALVAAMAVGSEAAKPKVSRRQLNQRAREGKLDKRTLMAGAKPHSEAAKKRALGNDSAITGAYSVQFQSCFSMTTSYEDMFDGDEDGAMTMSLMSAGEAMALESYAVFRLCYGTTCDSSTVLEYIVDLNTYVQSLINYLPEQMEGFCDACQENADTCQAMYGYQGGYGNRERKLGEFQQRVLENQVVRQLDCELCMEYNCLADDDNGEAENFEKASEWITEISECKETGIQYMGGYQNNGGYYQQQEEGAEMFAGIICNSAGTGIEIGMFYDEECKVYLPGQDYSTYMSYYDATYQSMTKELVEFTFSDNVFSCKEEEIIYTTQDLSQYNGYYGNQNWDNDDDDVAEWCEILISGDISTPTDMATCGKQYGGNYGNYYGNYYNNYGNGGSAYTYDWYTYDISEDDALDMSAVCEKIKEMEGQVSTYYSSNSANLYTYSRSSSSAAEDFGSEIVYKKKMSGAAKFGIVALVGLLIGAGAALYLKFVKTGGDDKNVGLIDPEEVEQKGGEVA